MTRGSVCVCVCVSSTCTSHFLSSSCSFGCFPPCSLFIFPPPLPPSLPPPSPPSLLLCSEIASLAATMATLRATTRAGSTCMEAGTTRTAPSPKSAATTPVSGEREHHNTSLERLVLLSLPPYLPSSLLILSVLLPSLTLKPLLSSSLFPFFVFHFYLSF